jgi:low affinity Fe/Cu permease
MKMKSKLKMFGKWAISFILCFIVIYLIVFFGGYKLFNSGDPILIEIGVALVLSIFVYAINEVFTKLDARIKALEERINELENIE